MILNLQNIKTSSLVSFLFRPVLFLFIILGLLMSINSLLKSDVSFTSIDSVQYVHFSDSAQKELLKGDIVSGTFISKYPNLGSVSLRFHNSGRINSDSVSFRFRPIGYSGWYYQSEHKTDQFQPHKLFPFGFPKIKNSQRQTYYFEIESVNGSPNDAILLEGNKFPNIVLRHKFKGVPLDNLTWAVPYLSSIVFQIVSSPGLVIKLVNNFTGFFIFYLLYKLIPHLMFQEKKSIKAQFLLLVIILYTLMDISFTSTLNEKTLVIGSFFWLIIIIFEKSLARISILFSFILFSLLSFQSVFGPSSTEQVASWAIILLLISIIQQIILYPRSNKTKDTSERINIKKKPQQAISSPSLVTKTALVMKAIKSVILWPFVCRNFPLGFLAYFKDNQVDKDITYRLYNGLKLISDGNCTDFQIIRELFVHDVYFKNFPLNLKQPVVFDIGAHKGYFSLFVKSKYKRAKIFSFEPSPENFSYLKKNLKHNRLRNISANQLAVSPKNTTVDFYLANKSSVCHSMLKSHLPFGTEKSIKVKGKTISALMNQNKLKKIDILKMDIEGLEYDILFNLPDRLFSKISVFMVEAHDTKKYQITHLKKFFQDKGCKTYQPYSQENVLVAYF
jgi:FkbM family methyltransferase